MSDPVTNVEIEDVLSSIRRLVSAEPQPNEPVKEEETVPADGPDAAAEEAQVRSEPKLVLTPAQRVDDDQDAESSLDDHADTAFAWEDDDGAEHVDDHDVDAQASEDESENADAASENADDQVETHEETADAGNTGPKDAFLNLVAQEIAAKAEADALAEVHVQMSEEQDDDAASQDAPFESAEFDEMSDPNVPEFLRRPVTQMNPPEDADSEVSNLEDTIEVVNLSEETPVSLTSKLETLEDAVAHQTDDWEPDGGDEDNLAPETIEPLPWNDIEAEFSEIPEEAIQEDQYAEAEAATDEAGSNAATPPWFGEDAVLDEDTLRDMVGEIVRQELQGALGERITRNVRKLVRREIHRALMSQGLD